MRIIGVIPSRLKSTRLPEKPLIDIDGLPMIIHVLKRAQMSAVLDDVFVATDSTIIIEKVTKYGGRAVMTSSSHQMGSDRVAEAVAEYPADIVVVINGDEPLLNPAHIDLVVEPLIKESDVQVAVLVTPYTKKNSPSDFKAVMDLRNNILFCSRNDIPSDACNPVPFMWKMCFMVPFRKNFLMQYASWGQTPLEKIESHEYVRILEHGYTMRAVPVEKAVISVDTPGDLAEVREIMKYDTLKKKYMI